ncbi:UNVERIFIED_CONTAM: Calmodulin-like protein 3 [Sesamum radiatum]|uniref:Calmodulin-like protein 3 n=1 Tax=Sesamum radiatum TaxID=300843 RepID=A0AAW2W4T7_SESRA
MDPAELSRVFGMFDRNGDGKISRVELSESLEKLGIHIPEKELKQMIDKIDVNGDGFVDEEEFGELCAARIMADENRGRGGGHAGGFQRVRPKRGRIHHGGGAKGGARIPRAQTGADDRGLQADDQESRRRRREWFF